MIKWTIETVRSAQHILSQHDDFSLALLAIGNALGGEVTRDSIANAFVRLGVETTPYQHLRKRRRAFVDRDTERQFEAAPISRPPVEIVDDSPREAPHERFSALVDLVKRTTRKGGVALEQVCDELGMSPKQARAYLEDARESGITIDVAHEKLLFRAPEASPNAPPLSVSPATVPGSDHRIGVFSDLHFGSSYCLKQQFRDFVLYCYHELGVRDFFCPGDVVEGYYRHAAFERTSESLDGQQTEFLETLPELPEMRVFLIDGNHDFTFTERTGVEAGRNLVRLARERGRNDLHFMGSRGALIQYGDTKIEMWHPKKGAAYALSYQLQNKVRDTAPARLPHILLTGHTHQYVKFRRSDCWAFYAGTFQHGDAPYGRALGGDVAMGGLIIDWRVDSDGVVRSLSDTFKLAHHEARTFDVAV